MRRTITIVSVFLAWLLGIQASIAFSDTVADQTLHISVLRVGTTGDYPPFSLYDHTLNQYQGTDIDRIRAFAQNKQLHIQWIPTTWQTLMTDLLDNRFDVAVGGISITPERAQQALFTIPYLKDSKVPLTQCNRVQQFSTLTQIDRPEVTVVSNAGGTNETFVKTNIHKAKMVLLKDNLETVDYLRDGRADVMITDTTEANYRQQHYPNLCAVSVSPQWNPIAKGFLLAKHSIPLKQKLDDWFRQNPLPTMDFTQP